MFAGPLILKLVLLATLLTGFVLPALLLTTLAGFVLATCRPPWSCWPPCCCWFPRIGLNVYNDQNENLGAISEILLFVVIGVGGLLGIGQHDIMVEMSKLKFVDEPVRTSSTTTSTTGSATTTTTPTTKSKWYPDHAVLSGATKDSLKNMAEFKYD